MLGNQYFMARNFIKALKELEPIYYNNKKNKAVRRKLIIGYAQTGQLLKALHIFHSLVKEDIQFIIKADSIYDDCPCEEIVQNLHLFPKEFDEGDFNLYSGILWLYCDPQKSLLFFNKAKEYFPEEKEIRNIISIIKNYISK